MSTTQVVVTTLPETAVVVNTQQVTVEVSTPDEAQVLQVGIAGPQGPPGPRGDPGPVGGAVISSDAGNALANGTDAGLFVPEAFTVAARLAELAEDPQAQQDARDNLGLTVIDGGTFN